MSYLTVSVHKFSDVKKIYIFFETGRFFAGKFNLIRKNFRIIRQILPLPSPMRYDETDFKSANRLTVLFVPFSQISINWEKPKIIQVLCLKQ